MPHISRLRKKYGRVISHARRREIVRRSIDEHILRIEALRASNFDIKVGIVGAGYAGLYCGWLLAKLGVKNVTVFEAMDRVGGRVHSLYNFSKGRVIEAGAELIGLNHGALLSLMRIFDLALVDVPSEDQNTALKLDHPIVLDGHILSQKESEKVEKELDALLMRISDASKVIRFPDKPWLESEEVQNLDSISVAEVLDKWGIKGLVRKLFDLEITNDNVASPSKQSWLGLLCQVKGGSLCCNSREFWNIEELFRASDGNQAVAERLAEEIQKLYLNTPVTKIKYIREKQQFIVYDEKRKHKFDYVVLATPPSVWKNIKFSPKVDLQPYLPALGQAIKYLSTVESRFWLPERYTADSISDTVGETWEATANQTFNGRQYFNFTVFAGGSTAKKAINLQKKGDKKVFKHFQRGIDQIYNGQFSESVVNETLSFHSTIPFIETGYSYMGVGKVTTTGKLNNQPFFPYDNRMFFAGEYTSMIYYGYMEGALQSAIGVVEEMMH